MTGIVRWNPSNPLLGPGFGRLVDDFFGASGRGREEDVGSTSWMPAADVKETEDAIFVHVDLPGLDKDAIDISLEAGVLTIRGERGFSENESRDQYHRLERFYGKFSRSFRLPRNVVVDKVQATFTDGVLTLELPKSEEARPRQIAIN